MGLAFNKVRMTNPVPQLLDDEYVKQHCSIVLPCVVYGTQLSPYSKLVYHAGVFVMLFCDLSIQM